MSTGASLKTQTGTSEIENFRHSARIIQSVVQVNTAGLTQADSLVQPRPAGNCLNWVVGHLLGVYERALPMMGQSPILNEGALKRYDRGSPPIQDGGEAIEFAELMAAWEEASKRIDVGLAGLSEETLSAPAPFSPGNNPNETIRTLLTTLFFHQAYHAGQTGILRRIAGKECAIR
jgi:hypothetical protein